MRILTITHYQPPHRGGIESVAAALVEHYRRAGHEAVWLASDLPPVQAEPGQVRVPASNLLEERWGVPYPLWHPSAVSIVRHWVDWCDVVHCHDCLYPGTVLALRRAQRTGKPLLLTQHVGPVPYRSAALCAVQRGAYATIGRYVHARADGVVFVSHSVAAWFSQRVHYRRLPRVVSNGVDSSVFHLGDPLARCTAREQLGLPAGRHVVLFVGRFVEKKGLPIVEQAARRHSDSLFILIGEGPIDPRDWQLGNVVTLPFQSQTVLRDYYRASDLLFLPSVGEGFPLVVMEAMACGTPALIPQETFNAWNDGREFFLLSEDAMSSPASIDANSPLSNPAARVTIATYARTHWDCDRVAETYLTLLASLQHAR